MLGTLHWEEERESTVTLKVKGAHGKPAKNCLCLTHTATTKAPCTKK